MWINPEKNIKGMSLDIGSGNPAEGETQASNYVHQDIQPHPGIDLVCDITDLAQYVNFGSCKRIKSSHVMEHFPTKQIPDLFKMIYTLLEPGGNFELIVPNFSWHCELVLSGEEEQGIHYAFGGQLDEWDFHKTGFTPRNVKKYMKQAGFTVIHLDPSSSITCIGEK